ncbi:hypothetical protein V1525DRAFT_605 [Lipomyces kononenkoae]|uniref:Uncharacterized protein n=1 Tax=Lipomyces kononenkoae TaxID=34357 RepID=A0ACC3TB79_LIPKO
MMIRLGLWLSPRLRYAPHSTPHVRYASWTGRGRQTGSKSKKSSSTTTKVVQEVDGVPWWAFEEYENVESVPKNKLKTVIVDNNGNPLKARNGQREGISKQLTPSNQTMRFPTEKRLDKKANTIERPRRILPDNDWSSKTVASRSSVREGSTRGQPPIERWRLKVAKKHLRREYLERGLDPQPEPQPLKSQQGKKRERNPNKPYGKVEHAKLDLKKLGRLDENGNLNFTVYPWKPMLQSHRARIHHVKFPGFPDKAAVQPLYFYERVITWPYIMEREWLTGQQTIYRYEARLRPLFFSDWKIPEMWFTGHGKNQKDADKAAFVRMLSELHLKFDPNVRLDDFLPGQKYGIPYDPEVPIIRDKEMPHMVGRNVWLTQSLDTQLTYLEKVKFEIQRLSEIGKKDEINAWNKFLQLNLVHAVNHIREKVKAEKHGIPIETKPEQ